MLTLSNYDATNGDAALIYVANVDDVQVLGASDETARLKAANILQGGSGPSPTDPSTFEVLFGEVFPALVALDTPLYDETDINDL